VRTARVVDARLRLVVADSQAIDRGGLVGLLEEQRDFEVVGEAATVVETIHQCRALRPHVLILSLNLPSQDTSPAIPAIRAELPSIRIVALSERGAENCLVLNPPSRRLGVPAPKLACVIGVDCLQLAVTDGAMATLRRSADPEDLFRAVRAVAQGQAWYDPTTTNAMLSAESPEKTAHSLSTRELEVAAMIAEGQSNKEISTSLGISEPTVKKHVGRILEKLGLADRLQTGLFLARNPVVFKRRPMKP
jgi:DNA-binding NarL/FixJ family response regulator